MAGNVIKFVIIYGHPAIGKLTIAQELSKILNYKLFHNHFVADFVGSLFEFNSENYRKLSLKFRLDILDALSKEGVNGVIMTFFYSKPVGDKYIKTMIKKIEKNDDEIFFVRLKCKEEELKKRVVSSSRKDFGKISKLKDFNRIIKDFDLYSKIDFVKNIEIDNTKKTVKEVVKEIKRKI